MGFKPIFEEERQFFKDKTGIDLPTDCWRNGSKIYLDFNQPKPYLQFKVEDKKIKITKDNTKISYNQKKLYELISEYQNTVTDLFTNSVIETENMILNYPNHYWVVSHSGGKDSTLIYEIWKTALNNIQNKHPDLHINWIINFANTSNDTADTYKYIKKLPKDKLRILNPKQGWGQWLKETKNYFIPSKLVRNCCQEYKEGQLTKSYDTSQDIVFVLGVRKYESTKRANYDMIMDSNWRDKHFDFNKLPKKWINFAPAINWKDEEVWLYLLLENVEFNYQYKLGFNRCGCLICPFQADYIDLIIEKYYPKRWKWWESILKQNYDIYKIEARLKWSLTEWLNGKWKVGVSKEYELINLNPTKENIKQLAEIKGISENMAAKYFKKSCRCGKKMNPTELAMFYKLFGRYEDVTDDQRDLLCKKCLCKEMEITEKEYVDKSIQFLNSGCKLF